MKKINTVLSVLLIFVVVITFVFSTSANDIQYSTVNGFANVIDYGATPNDTIDDTMAFKKAVESGQSVYVPVGKYSLSETIILDDIKLVGVSSEKTELLSTATDLNMPIFVLLGSAGISDVRLGFDNFNIENPTKEGEMVAVRIGDQTKSMNCGGYIKNVIFDEVGTAIYSPKYENLGANNILIETIEIVKFSYRGIDMQSENRFGNTYSNIYINAHDKTEAYDTLSSAFALEGSEYGAVINQLNVEHTKLEYPIILKNIEAMAVSSIHVEGVYTTIPDMGYIYCENTSGYIAAYTTFFTRVREEENSVICFGDTQGEKSLRIGSLQIKGINRPDAEVHPDYQDIKDFSGKAESFKMLDRKNGTNGDWNINLEYYSYYSYTTDAKLIYEAFPIDKTLKINKLYEAEE